MATVRPYDQPGDAAALWELKAAFERGLGASGDEGKRAEYEEKLTDAYRERYLAWVRDCVAENADCVQVAVDESTVVGYVFVLPASCAFIWDGAVLNELYVREAHRGTGVADALIEAALTVAQDQSLPMDRLLLDVDRTNARARRFYERHEFEHWGEMLARDL